MFWGKSPAKAGQLFTTEELTSVSAMVAHGVHFRDGALTAQGGLLVDGQLSNCRQLSTTDKSLIRISVRSEVASTLIDCHDLLIEGKAQAVVIIATGRVEIGPTAVVVGSLFKGPSAQLYVAPSADVTDLTIKPISDSMRVSMHVPQTAGASLDLSHEPR